MDAEAALEDGEIARREKRYADASAAFKKAAEIFQANRDETRLAHALTRQAQISRDMKHLDQAARFQREALALIRVQKGPVAHTIRHLAEILSEDGKADEADRLYTEMISLYRNDPATPPLDMANAVRSVALHAEAQGERELAVRLWTEARRRYAALDDLFLEMLGSADNPGVLEADRRLQALQG